MEMTKKKKSEKEQASNREYQKEYYQRNKAELAARRKERYESDPEYQRKMKLAAKRRYWLGTRPESARDPKLPDVTWESLEPKGLIPIVVENSEDVRNGQLVEVPVFTTAVLEQVLGRNAQTLRVWYKEGILPEPFFRGRMVPVKIAKGRNPRLITEDELRVIFECRDKLALPSHGKQHDIFTRCVEEGFKKLRQGLVPVTQ